MSIETVYPTTKLRHQEIYDEYLKVLAENGRQARNLSKKSLYYEVASRLHYSEDHVCKVIAKILKSPVETNNT